MNKPLCFVLMPFGKKPDAAGAVVDFDAVYRGLIAPSIVDAGMEPLRADEEMTGGVIHKRSEEHTSELQSRQYLVCRLLLEKKKYTTPSLPRRKQPDIHHVRAYAH